MRDPRRPRGFSSRSECHLSAWHESAATDYCDRCGARMDGTESATSVDSSIQDVEDTETTERVEPSRG